MRMYVWLKNIKAAGEFYPFRNSGESSNPDSDFLAKITTIATTIITSMTSLSSDAVSTQITAQFEDGKGKTVGPTLVLPLNITRDQLDDLLNEILTTHKERNSEGSEEDEKDTKYSYFINDTEILHSIHEDIRTTNELGEVLVKIQYRPMSLFRVNCVTRCSSTLTGHGEAILSVSFSPDGRQLASGSGDSSVRFWDLNTETPKPAAIGSISGLTHKDWVLCITWSPDGRYLASGSMDTSIIVWDGTTEVPVGKKLSGHKGYITCLVWQPLHLLGDEQSSPLLGSASKDHTIKVWDPTTAVCLISLTLHTDIVTCLRWTGNGYLFSGSRDRLVRAWDVRPGKTFGKCIQTLKGHAHWVNCMSLSSDYALRIGPFHPESSPSLGSKEKPNVKEMKHLAQKTFEQLNDHQVERLVTGSDDFTLILWNSPLSSDAHVRLTGHQGLINQVTFSPKEGRLLASGSFDKSVKIWDGQKGQLLYTLRGHVGSIYQLSWSSDNRWIVSGSKDGTLKVWRLGSTEGKLHMNLPGHLDEVYSVDWSPDGSRVASGSKDKTLKM